MKNKILFFFLTFLSVHCLLTVKNCVGQWVQVSTGMGNKNIISFTSSGSNIFAGTNGQGIYYSTNNGSNWILKGLQNRNIFSMAANGNYIFAGIDTAICRSSDNGTTWTFKNLMYSSQITSIVINGNDILASAQNLDAAGIYYSSDNGNNWMCIKSVVSSITRVAILQDIFFVSTSSPPCSFYKSTNFGLEWSYEFMYTYGLPVCIGTGNNFIYLGTIKSSFNDSIYGLCSSNNLGNSWTMTSLFKRNVNTIATLGDNIIAGAEDSGVYVSTNSGLTWEKKNEGFPSTFSVNSLYIFNDYIYAGIHNNSAWRRPLSELITNSNISQTKIPDSYSLMQNYPNPFNPNTIIRFQIKDSRFVTLKVYDVNGKEIINLVNEYLKAGTYEVPFSIFQFSNKQLSSGIYFYSLYADEEKIDTKRMVLIK